ncbi:MAG: hypothetical protein KDB00_08060 [Planctomycetales bacterium]|nr:hypothetical protein [Planctomycetales bacterium]
MTEFTRIISRIESGNRAATEQLLPHVYKELRKLAEQKLAGDQPGQTLQATALVHEEQQSFLKSQAPLSRILP